MLFLKSLIYFSKGESDFSTSDNENFIKVHIYSLLIFFPSGLLTPIRNIKSPYYYLIWSKISSLKTNYEFNFYLLSS